MRVFLFLCIIFEIPLAIVSPNLNLRTMDLTFSTPLKGNIVLCSDYRAAALHRSPGLYKFVWVRRGCLRLEVDHIPMELRAGMLLPLTPLHTLDVTRAEGEYLILAFDTQCSGRWPAPSRCLAPSWFGRCPPGKSCQTYGAAPGRYIFGRVSGLPLLCGRAGPARRRAVFRLCQTPASGGATTRRPAPCRGSRS